MGSSEVEIKKDLLSPRDNMTLLLLGFFIDLMMQPMLHMLHNVCFEGFILFSNSVRRSFPFVGETICMLKPNQRSSLYK